MALGFPIVAFAENEENDLIWDSYSADDAIVAPGDTVVVDDISSVQVVSETELSPEDSTILGKVRG